MYKATRLSVGSCDDRNSVAGTEFGKTVAGVETIKTC